MSLLVAKDKLLLISNDAVSVRRNSSAVIKMADTDLYCIHRLSKRLLGYDFIHQLSKPAISTETKDMVMEDYLKLCKCTNFTCVKVFILVTETF